MTVFGQRNDECDVCHFQAKALKAHVSVAISPSPVSLIEEIRVQMERPLAWVPEWLQWTELSCWTYLQGELKTNLLYPLRFGACPYCCKTISWIIQNYSKIVCNINVNKAKSVVNEDFTFRKQKLLMIVL